MSQHSTRTGVVEEEQTAPPDQPDDLEALAEEDWQEVRRGARKAKLRSSAKLLLFSGVALGSVILFSALIFLLAFAVRGNQPVDRTLGVIGATIFLLSLSFALYQWSKRRGY